MKAINQLLKALKVIEVDKMFVLSRTIYYKITELCRSVWCR